VVVIAPLFEEWICRGLIFGSLRSRYGVVRSMVLSALVFGLMHVQPVPVLNAFVLGLVLAFIYHKTNSLWSSVILHALYNGTAYLLTIMGFEDQSFRSLFGDHMMGYATFYGAALILFVVSFFAIARVLKTAPKTPLQEGKMGPSAQKITPVE
jgi:membrane protease YdiL (CAAX protease family)